MLRAAQPRDSFSPQAGPSAHGLTSPYNQPNNLRCDCFLVAAADSSTQNNVGCSINTRIDPRKEAEGRVTTEVVYSVQVILCLKSVHPSGFGSLLILRWRMSQSLLPAHTDQRDCSMFEQKGVIRTNVPLFCWIFWKKPSCPTWQASALSREIAGPLHTWATSEPSPFQGARVWSIQSCPWLSQVHSSTFCPFLPASPGGLCFSTGNVRKSQVTMTDGSCSEAHQTVPHRKKPFCPWGQYGGHWEMALLGPDSQTQMPEKTRQAS